MSNKKQMYHIESEDYMLDLLLKHKQIFGKKNINTWLKDVFYEPAIPFKIEGSRLVIQLEVNLDLFKDFLNKNKHIHFLDAFEAAFIRIVQNREQNFDIFNKVILREGRTVQDGFSIFILWVSRYFRPGISAFIFDFLIVWLYTMWLKKPDDGELRAYFIEYYLRQENYCEEKESIGLYNTVYGPNRVKYIEMELLLSYVVDYFLGNDLLQDAYPK